MTDPNSTIDAIALLETVRMDIAGHVPHSVWAILAHASRRLDQELRAYYIPDVDGRS